MMFSLVLCSVLLVTGAVCTDVDTTWIRNTLRDYFSQPRHHVANPTYKASAKNFIKNEFESYGLATYVHTFDSELPEVKGHNVIGLIKGRHFNTSSDKILGMAAHYDTMRGTPGVDDNGAAVVAMLQAAKVLARSTRDFTIVFVAFDFEEWEENVPEIGCSDSLCGSAKFMAEWAPTMWTSLPNITGVIVMDCIMNVNQANESQSLPFGFDLAFPNAANSVKSDGRQGDFLTVIGRPYDSVVMAAFINAYDALGQEEFEMETVNITALTGPVVSPQEAVPYSDLMRSDHFTFWKIGLPAIFLTDTANFRKFQSGEICYHKACDQMSAVTDSMIQFVGKTTQALIITVNSLVPPTGTVDTTTPQPSSASTNARDRMMLVFLAMCCLLRSWFL